ncbi:MAG: LemA family protein [Gammaproteobacteria bacterium]|nr:LemA family protein [Gammaproteobacteria bacterium]
MSYDPHAPASDRLRRSQDRLRELYHDEVNPRFRVPYMPGLKIVIVISLLTLVFFSATMLFKFNYFIGLQEEVFAKRGHLEGAYQRRINLFENLLKLTLNHAALEHEVFAHVSDVRKEIIKKLNLPPEMQRELERTMTDNPNPDFGDVSKIIEQLGSGSLETSMGRLLGIVEQYPNIKSSETYLKLIESLIEIEDRIAERRMTYQETIRIFNQEISRFPWYMLAQVTGFARFDYFESEKEGHYRPRISADIFEELLPLTGNYNKNLGKVLPQTGPILPHKRESAVSNSARPELGQLSPSPKAPDVETNPDSGEQDE